MNFTMKVVSSLLLALYVGSTNTGFSFNNGEKCTLEAKISCEVDVGGGQIYPYSETRVVEKVLCDEGLGCHVYI